MRQASKRIPESAEKTVRDIRRATRRHHSAEEKIRIVLEGLRGEDSIAELCRKEGINQNLYYRWSKEFLEAGKKRLAGDTAREATSDEVKELKAEARQLKETLAEVLIENRLLKKSVLADLEQDSLTRSKRRSSIWPLRSRTCRRASSPSTSRTQRAALCQKPPFIGSRRTMA